jgi:hypothetical protein
MAAHHLVPDFKRPITSWESTGWTGNANGEGNLRWLIFSSHGLRSRIIG